MAALQDKKSYLKFVLLYCFIYMCLAIYTTFIPVYLSEIGYNNTEVGLLLSVSPIVAMVGHPFWGYAGDKARYKNTVLAFLIVSCSLLAQAFLFSTNFIFLMGLIMVFTFFSASVAPITDAITLEYSKKTNWSYGHIRMSGTIGYAVMAIVAGIITKSNIGIIFPLYFAMGLAAFTMALLLPKVGGHLKKDAKASVFSLLKDKELLIFFLFAFLIQATIGYNYTFSGIYMNELGGDTSYIGMASFVSAMAEIPFLMLSAFFFKRFKVKSILLFSGIAAVVRWTLCGLSTAAWMVVASQALHGFMFIAISVSLATYINHHAPDEYKASGQALNALVNAGARILGSMAGGWLSDAIGIRKVYIVMALFCLGVEAVFGLVLFKGSQGFANRKDWD